MPFQPENIRKILILRFSSIGDIVLTTPVIRCLRQQTKAEVHYLTKQAYLPLLEGNPFLDKVYTFEKKLSEVLPAIKEEHYDIVVDLHKNWRTFRIRLELRTARFLTFDKLNLEKWFLVRFGINRLPAVHIAHRYLAAVAPLGIRDDQLGLDYYFPPEFSQAPALPFYMPATPFIAFAIGAAHATKRLPSEKIIQLCRMIDIPVVLLGGTMEKETGELIAQQAGRHVINTCGQLTLHESAWVICAAHKVVTHDTGMMHIAAAFQKEIISIWGNTVPGFGMYPYYGANVDKNTTFEVKGLPCRPCSKIGFQRCPKGHFRCMNDQNMEAIAERIPGKAS